MSGKSTETVAKPQDRLAKPTIQPQLARVKREEDEEDSQDLWISGEELYTDGSSDEEDSRAQWRSRRKINSYSSRTPSSTSSTDRRGRSPNQAKGSAKNIYNAAKNRSTENVTDLLKSLNDDKRESSNTGSTYTMSCSTDRTRGTCANSKDRAVVNENLYMNVSNENDCQRRGALESVIVNSPSSTERANHVHDTWIITDTVETDMMEEMLKVQELDIAMEEVCKKLTEVTEETLSYQRENRERLRTMLESSTVERGRLAKNTQEFFALYPRYSEFLLDKCTDNTGNVKAKEKIFINISSYNKEMQIQRKKGRQLLNVYSKNLNLTDDVKENNACSLKSQLVTRQDRTESSNLSEDLNLGTTQAL